VAASPACEPKPAMEEDADGESEPNAAADSTCEPGRVEELQLEVCTLSGNSKPLAICSSATLHEARLAIEELIGVPATSQRWLVGEDVVVFKAASTIAQTKVRSGDQITVLHAGFAPLVPLPDTFDLKLTSVHERMKTRSISSSFTILYKITADIPEGVMVLEPWRKNDHDRLVFDSKAGTFTAEKSHWMAGKSTHTAALKNDPLAALLNGWSAAVEPVTKDSERFWRTPDVEDAKKAARGWFMAPSADCVEILADVPLDNKRIVRLLIDGEGMPVSAAIAGCKIGECRKDLEEFDVELTALEEPASGESRAVAGKSVGAGLL